MLNNIKSLSKIQLEYQLHRTTYTVLTYIKRPKRCGSNPVSLFQYKALLANVLHSIKEKVTLSKPINVFRVHLDLDKQYRSLHQYVIYSFSFNCM